MTIATAASIHCLRLIGLAEAASFLVLGVAMVFKYGSDQPLGVKIAGPVHGGLYLLYLIALIHAWRGSRWPCAPVLLLFVAALVPCGPFFSERWLRREELAAAKRSTPE